MGFTIVKQHNSCIHCPQTLMSNLFRYSNLLTVKKEPIVSITNRSLVGTLITIGDVTVSIAIDVIFFFAFGLPTKTMVAYGCHSKINNCLSIFIVYCSFWYIFLVLIGLICLLFFCFVFFFHFRKGFIFMWIVS